jgi:hypothetical protein
VESNPEAGLAHDSYFVIGRPSLEGHQWNRLARSIGFRYSDAALVVFGGRINHDLSVHLWRTTLGIFDA